MPIASRGPDDATLTPADAQPATPYAQRSRRRSWLRRVGVVVGVSGIWLAWSIGGALAAPGTDPAVARLAEWARFHGLGSVVSAAEQLQYQLDPPQVGGSPAAGIPLRADARATPEHTTKPVPAAPPPPVAPAAIPVQAQPALPGEGEWQPLVTVKGRPAIQAAFLRPDAAHTSYLVGVALLDQKLVTMVLHPGTQVPGSTGWSQPSQVPTTERDSVLATFNSGFAMRDANGGYWQDGKSVGSLRAGAASMVLYRDGHVDVVSWDGSAPGPEIAAVRQNLGLLVDNGVISPDVDSTTTRTWGKTVGNATYVWRSGLGIRADGSLVFVVGNSMSVHTLANVIRDAGAVRAMELDINTSWTNFMTYTHPSAGVAVPQMLTSDEKPFPGRYLQASSRDFVAVLPR
ncbi:MAG: phosphodiester glycosidase family protein [Cellulomonas sp.]